MAAGPWLNLVRAVIFMRPTRNGCEQQAFSTTKEGFFHA